MTETHTADTEPRAAAAQTLDLTDEQARLAATAAGIRWTIGDFKSGKLALTKAQAALLADAKAEVKVRAAVRKAK